MDNPPVERSSNPIHVRADLVRADRPLSAYEDAPRADQPSLCSGTPMAYDLDRRPGHVRGSDLRTACRFCTPGRYGSRRGCSRIFAYRVHFL